MLSAYFEDTRTLEKLVSELAGSYLEGYALETSRRYLRAATHLGLWTGTANCIIEDLNEESLTRFAGHLPCCACNGASKDKSPDIIVGAKHFFNYLGELGVIRLEKNEHLQSFRKPLFEDFCKWTKRSNLLFSWPNVVKN